MSSPTAYQAHSLTANERLIMDALRREGAMTRAALSTRMDLAQQSVHRLIEQLIEQGLLEVGETVRNGRGQPSPRIDLVRDAAYAIGVSINPDSAVVSLADLGCTVREEVHIRAPQTNRTASLIALNETIGRILARNGVPRERVVGVGFAIAGFFVADRRQFNTALPLRDWSLIDLKPLLEANFQLPVWLESNVITAAVGENLSGVGRWARNFVYFSFNFGFRSGIIIDGKPYFGANGNAGGIQMHPKEERWTRPALEFLIEELARKGTLVDSLEDLQQRFDPEWPGVEEWIVRVLPGLNRIVNAVASMLDPEAIVFAGQIARPLGQMLIDRTTFWDELERYNQPPRRPRLVLSETNGDAAALGAALTPLKHHFF